MFVASISPSRNLETAQPGRCVFISERGAPMSAVAFRRMVTRLGPAAKMPFGIHPPCCGIQPGSSWPIRVWILGRCNTISAIRTSSIRFDIANWGLRRLYMDALLSFGNIRQAYRSLRTRDKNGVILGSNKQRFKPNEMIGSRPAGLPDENLKPKSPVTIGNSRSVYWWCSPPNIGTANI
jgi:hypothetical protein